MRSSRKPQLSDLGTCKSFIQLISSFADMISLANVFLQSILCNDIISVNCILFLNHPLSFLIFSYLNVNFYGKEWCAAEAEQQNTCAGGNLLVELLRRCWTGAQLVEVNVFSRHCKLHLILFSSCSPSHPAVSGIKGFKLWVVLANCKHISRFCRSKVNDNVGAPNLFKHGTVKIPLPYYGGNFHTMLTFLWKIKFKAAGALGRDAINFLHPLFLISGHSTLP